METQKEDAARARGFLRVILVNSFLRNIEKDKRINRTGRNEDSENNPLESKKSKLAEVAFLAQIL